MSQSLHQSQHHTFIPWQGRIKAKQPRSGSTTAMPPLPEHVLSGSDRPARFMDKAYWAQPVEWEAEAAAAGVRERVLCAPEVDLFGYARELESPRRSLLNLIYRTPHLDWLLLTKYPENVVSSLPPEPYAREDEDPFPPRAWFGTVVTNQEDADQRVPDLLDLQSVIGRFVSCEPLVGPVDLRKYLQPGRYSNRVDWVLCGGEAGPNARLMRPEWVEGLQAQCLESGVPFLFKHWGKWAPVNTIGRPLYRPKLLKLVRKDGSTVQMVQGGTKANGRTLLGQTWDQFPDFPGVDTTPW